MKRKSYDFLRDVLGEFLLDDVRELFETNAAEFKALFSWSASPTSPPLGVVLEVCESVKRMIEEKEMWKLLYRDSAYKEPKYEEAAQILFGGLAEEICKRCNVDATREPETGRGPVDFKFSRGARGKVLVETKLSTNANLVHALDMVPMTNKGGKPMPLELHHGDQMPGAGIHEVDAATHRQSGVHGQSNQGVTPEMRRSDAQLHWKLRGKEQGGN